MEIFFSSCVEGGYCHLDADESAHCVRVLRHREGDEISVIDGLGTLYSCVLTEADPRDATARVVSEQHGWGSHPYHLTMAVCPTKNLDRYEWFAEKATECGIDVIAPVIGEHSERRIFKPERLQRILLSATKQSLKGAIPQIEDPVSVDEFIRSTSEVDALKLICYCFEGEAPRTSIMDALDSFAGSSIIVLIGPEGDFSREEAVLALESGYIPVHLGHSRLRTETAALTAVEAVYLKHI